ncbi:MAG: anti-sigma regulatory factor [Caldilineaceae bacterium]
MNQLTLPGALDSLALIRDYVESAALRAGLDKKQIYRLTLAVDEIATNSIVHGYAEAGLTGEVTIGAHLQPSALTVYLEDRAAPYNPLRSNLPSNLDAALHEREIGGLGVFLALKNVDEFRYEYENGQNRNIFVMKLNEKSE